VFFAVSAETSGGVQCGAVCVGGFPVEIGVGVQQALGGTALAGGAGVPESL